MQNYRHSCKVIEIKSEIDTKFRRQKVLKIQRRDWRNRERRGGGGRGLHSQQRAKDKQKGESQAHRETTLLSLGLGYPALSSRVIWPPVPNSHLKGIVRRKLRWVKKGINRQLFLYCRTTYIFFLFKGTPFFK